MAQYKRVEADESKAELICRRLKSWRFEAKCQGREIVLDLDRRDLSASMKTTLAVLDFVPASK
jgi:hypothetical protein